MTGTCVLYYVYYKLAVIYQVIVFAKFQVGSPASSPAKPLEPHLCVLLSLMVMITL